MNALPSDSSVDPTSSSRFINRELSWLDFNDRVLALAEDPSLPLLERVKFVAIFTANLDEFFQVRVAGLSEQADAGIVSVTPDGMTPVEQLESIEHHVRPMLQRIERLVGDELFPALAKSGIRIEPWTEIDAVGRKALRKEFNDRIFPVLTPLSVDPAHPFPYVSSLSLNLAVLVRDPESRARRFARVKVPPLLPRFLALPDGERWVPIEDVIAAHLDELFPGMEILEHHVFRVTRDADLDVEEDEADDLLAAVETVLHRRRRGAVPVRLEVSAAASSRVQTLLMRELDLSESQVYPVEGLLDLAGLSALVELDRPDLKDDPWVPVTQPRLVSTTGPAEMFGILRAGDLLLHHPYDSFTSSVEAFVEQAAIDPDVLAIKQTLYRTSVDSPILRALMRAAEAGKQVVALVELKARFDEQANITWARALEQSGVHVVYGMVGLKTHAKICLVVRREGSRIRRYAHVGTGNYNPFTARLYEDLGLLTGDPDLGADLTELFNLLTGYSRQRDYRRLLVAPLALRRRILELIAREAGETDGSIALKVNSLVDAEIIDALYEASRAGVEVDLIVRGICCLKPGVPGLSDRIRVRSIVGRFLEHSRVFRFGSEARGFEHYIGSADLMPRNLDHRVEVAVPVVAPELRARLDEILRIELEDDLSTWELGPDGTWSRVATRVGIGTHARLMELAAERAHGSP